MTVSERIRTPAEIYDEMFVPALFRHWGPVVAEAADIRPGHRVLDVACGTGTLAEAAAGRVGSEGRVSGLDPNPDMLGVARRNRADIDWRDGRAEAIPFADASFDRVVSQFGMMFFDDGPAALREMMRVLVPGGRLAVAVCDVVERSPGYATLAALLDRLFGTRVGNAFRAPFVLGDPELLRTIAAEAGIEGVEVARRSGSVRFGSIAALVATERACVWTLGGILDEDQFRTLLAQADEAFGKFVTADGEIVFDMPALILTAEKPG